MVPSMWEFYPVFEIEQRTADTPHFFPFVSAKTIDDLNKDGFSDGCGKNVDSLDRIYSPILFQLLKNSTVIKIILLFHYIVLMVWFVFTKTIFH